MIKIEAAIPIPPASGSRGRLYPFQEMNVGDSFAVQKEKRQSLDQSANHWKRRHPGWDYATRAVGTEVRIWRIA